MLRAYSHGVECEGKARIAPRRAHDGANRLLVRGKGFQAPHQHVEQALAGRLLGHVVIDTCQHGPVNVLDMGRENGKRRAEFRAQLRKFKSGLASDLREADLLEGVLREQ